MAPSPAYEITAPNRRRNCGYAFTFMRVLAVLLCKVGLIFLIRYDVNQDGNGPIVGGVVGTVGVRLHP